MNSRSARKARHIALVVPSASQIFLQSGDRGRDGVRVIAERGPQITGLDEPSDQLLRGCLGISDKLRMSSSREAK
jgi:hypothetical protein